MCDVSTSAEVCHDALVDLSREETFEAPDDLTFGAAVGRTSHNVVDRWLVVPHADDDRPIEGGVGLAVTAVFGVAVAWPASTDQAASASIGVGARKQVFVAALAIVTAEGA